jgi:DNA modification methylase
MAELYKIMKAAFIGMIILVLVPVFLFAQGKAEEEIFDSRLSLLLNSGYTENNKASLKYILWTQDGNELEELELYLQNFGFSWKKEILNDYSGCKRAYKYTAQTEVDKEAEKRNLKKINVLAKDIRRFNAYLYIHEEVKGNVDVEQYLQYIRVRDVERTKEAGLISYTGYTGAINQAVQAGLRKINFQLITKDNNLYRETVLAIPALLEEF